MRMRPLLSRLAVGLALLAPSLAGPAAAVDPVERVLMVLDGSGSMWGQIEGRNKIVIARDVVGRLIEGWKPAVHLGIMAYGHREKGDCDDIELLLPVGPVDPERVKAVVDGIGPKGKTPITAAVTRAAEALRYSEEKATVLLVSDGLETCGADPCAAARQLEATGVDLTVHVVGFDIDEAQQGGLACLAAATGGKYLSAATAEELQSALGEATKEIAASAPSPPSAPPSAVEAEAEPEPEPATAAPSGPQGLKLQATLAEGADPLEDDVFWWIYEAAADAEGKRREVKRNGSARPLIEMPAGDYFVVAGYGKARMGEAVTVAEGALSAVTLVLNAGNLRVDAIPTAGMPPLDDDMFYWLYEGAADLAGKREEVARDGSAVALFKVPAGEYRVIGGHGKARAFADVTVLPGELTETTLDMNVGYLRATSIPAEGAAPLDEAFYWLYDGEKDLQGRREEVARDGSAVALFKMSAGAYHLVAGHGKARAAQDVTVAAGALTEVTLNLNVGYLRADTILAAGQPALAEGPFYWLLGAKKDLQGKRREVDRDGSASALFRVPAGDYVVQSRVGNATVQQEVSVTAGALTEATLDLNAGRIAAQAARGGVALGDGVFWYVMSGKADLAGKRREIARSGGAEPVFTLPAGDYVLVARVDKETVEQPVTVRAGEDQRVAVPVP